MWYDVLQKKLDINIFEIYNFLAIWNLTEGKSYNLESVNLGTWSGSKIT